jgi:DNA topoisomerase-1
MQELPGEELFHYIDEDGEPRPIESADVNAYLRSIAGEDFTSKDFRTWAGTLLCARALAALQPPRSATAGRRDIRRAVEAASEMLRNTPAVCRKCYIHPRVFESYLGGRLQDTMQGRSEETALIELLEQRARRPADLAGAERQLRARRLRRVAGHGARTRHSQLHPSHRGRRLGGDSGLRAQR